jgi:hypothetical protein
MRSIIIKVKNGLDPLSLLALAVRAKESRESMKKDKNNEKDELREEYKLADFSDPLVRGKYAKPVNESSNIIVLKPEVAEVFPNEEAVNSALLSLIKFARTTTRLTNKDRLCE